MNNKLALIVGVITAVGLSAASAQDVKIDARTQAKAERSASAAIRLRNGSKDPASVRVEAAWIGSSGSPQDAFVASFSFQNVELQKNEEKKLEMASGGARVINGYGKMVGWAILVVDAKTNKVIASAASNPRYASIAEGRPYAQKLEEMLTGR